MRWELKDGELEAKTIDLADEMRRSGTTKAALISYAEARVLRHMNALSAPLLNGETSDMLRGRIAELKNLIDDMQSKGE